MGVFFSSMSFQQGRRKLKRNKTTHLFGIAKGITNMTARPSAC